jgi:hypothetical protein
MLMVVFGVAEETDGVAEEPDRVSPLSIEASIVDEASLDVEFRNEYLSPNSCVSERPLMTSGPKREAPAIVRGSEADGILLPATVVLPLMVVESLDVDVGVELDEEVVVEFVGISS